MAVLAVFSSRAYAAWQRATQDAKPRQRAFKGVQKYPPAGRIARARGALVEICRQHHWNRVSVWTDVVFMLIALFTQLYWLVRWDFLDSMTCTLAMLSVLVCNSIMLGLVYYSRAAYVRHRVALCTLSKEQKEPSIVVTEKHIPAGTDRLPVMPALYVVL
ncbi:hypothetical protein WJX72_005774 [[Myrmecia] bisecta]|uniref:Uncharacterized protein n=1 Tax=[Myrmecia] bisecta TaxID=41462 RepID=A0AAW1P6X9_9CHLO